MTRLDVILVVVFGLIIGFGSAFAFSSMTWDYQLEQLHSINEATK